MSTEALAHRLSEEQARDLTEQVKADAAALWAKLLELYEGEAHLALGYSSWGAYYEAEFGESGSHGYRLLAAAEVVGQLPSHPRVTERVARELVPLKDDPEPLRETWAGIVEEHGDSPTAAQVREAVTVEKDSPGVRALAQQRRLLGGVAEKARRIEELAPHLDLEVVGSLPEGEEKEAWKQQLSNARTALSRLIAAL